MLDSSGLPVAKQGKDGELHITGEWCLSSGYLDKDTTRERFRVDSSSSKMIVYATRDKLCELGDARLKYLGEFDKLDVRL